MKKDMKEALTGARKPDITHMRGPTMVYTARGCEYGIAKGYERANYQRLAGELREDWNSSRTYLRAAISHCMAQLDSMEAYEAQHPELNDAAGMAAAAYAADTDAPPPGAPGHEIGASRLPHACGMAASVNMFITKATLAGFLPADPGQPWAERKVPTPLAPTMFYAGGCAACGRLGAIDPASGICPTCT